jgi:hypothetical protein
MAVDENVQAVGNLFSPWKVKAVFAINDGKDSLSVAA